MLASISPLGERARGNRWWLTVAALTAGGTVAGATTGAVVGGAGQLTAWSAAWTGGAATGAFAVAAATAAMADGLRQAGIWPVRYVPARRQVNEYWLDRYRGWVYGAGFGVQLGAGVATIVTTATVYLLFVAEFLTRSWAEGAVLGGLFGAARAAPALAAGWARTGSRLRRLHGAMAAADRAAAWATVAGAVGTAALLGARW